MLQKLVILKVHQCSRRMCKDMPAFYAHYRFGCDVLKVAPPPLRTICEKHRALFDIGLHGPDIFFFYRPLIPNSVTKYGHQCHGRTGGEFLIRAKEVINGSANKDASLAYFYGFLCHLALDSVCHPYVYEAMKLSGESHTAIETSLDFSLLTLDGIPPLSHDPCRHFKISQENAEIISPFFPPLDAQTVEKSLRAMVSYGRILYIKNTTLRKILDLSLYLTFHHDSLAGMLMKPSPNPHCIESDRELQKLYSEATKLALKLFQETTIYIENEISISTVFERTFKGTL